MDVDLCSSFLVMFDNATGEFLDDNAHRVSMFLNKSVFENPKI